ncbi:MAG: CHASE2 domain-containing protein [candidate division Zixibacteria bacterium]|nr:CHASE2 domain-containing protein [candidate division Zixibacteria bacterium]
MSKRNKNLWGLAAGFLSVLIVVVLSESLLYDIVASFESKTLDWRFVYRERMRDERPPIEDIVVVDIDERSLEKYGQFPWSRGYHADLIEYLIEDGALGVAFDIQFFDAPDDSAGNTRFVSAVKNTGMVINAVALYPEDKERFRYRMQTNPYEKYIPDAVGFEDLKPVQFERVDGPSMELAKASAALGFVNFIPDLDGVTRRLPLALKAADDIFFSLSISAVHALVNGYQLGALRYKDGFLFPSEDIAVPVDEYGNFIINYVGPPKSFRYISYYDVREQRLPPGYFEGRFVLVGTSARGLSDLKITPLSNEFPGVEIHANVMYNILTGDYLRKLSPWILLPIIALVNLILGLVFYRSGPFWGIGLFILCSVGYFIFVILMFNNNSLEVDLVRPIFLFSLTYILVVVHRYFGEEQEKKRYRGILQHYVAPTVVKHIVDNIEQFKLGGESRELTMLFSDIEGFTEISEKLTAPQLVSFLNEYTTIQTEAVFEYYGTLDKYIGDALVVIFGAPEFHLEVNYAECACRAALKMSENDKKISGKFKNMGVGNVHTRIGINTGEVVVGNMGSNIRFSYTVIGDHVNLASRLEGLNKEYRTDIIISEMVRQYTSKAFITRELDLVKVKGRSKPVRIYELVKYGEMDSETEKFLKAFSKALGYYRQRQFDNACEAFKKVLEIHSDDGPAQVFSERCRILAQNPPPEDWDGVWVMRTK